MSQESIKLSELLQESSLHVGDVRIPAWLADQFTNRSDPQVRRSKLSPKIFLEALLTEKPDKIVELLETLGVILSDVPQSELEIDVISNLKSDGDVWTHALVEAQHWFSRQIVWGWVEDPFKRPDGHDMGSANGFFHSCLELVRQFLVTGGNPRNTADIKKFLRENGELTHGSTNEPELRLRWPGWEIYESRNQPETIHLKRIKRSQRTNESTDEFFARILANVAEETIIQMCMPDKEAYFQSTTFTPKETDPGPISKATITEDNPEVLLLRMMLGDLSYEPKDADMARKITATGHLLGFFRRKSKVDKFMEDFADRALAARNLSNNPN